MWLEAELSNRGSAVPCHTQHIPVVQKRKGEAMGLPDQVKILPQTWGGRISSSHINRETDLAVGGPGGGPPVPMGKS